MQTSQKGPCVHARAGRQPAREKEAYKKKSVPARVGIESGMVAVQVQAAQKGATHAPPRWPAAYGGKRKIQEKSVPTWVGIDLVIVHRRAGRQTAQEEKGKILEICFPARVGTEPGMPVVQVQALRDWLHCMPVFPQRTIETFSQIFSTAYRSSLIKVRSSHFVVLGSHPCLFQYGTRNLSGLVQRS